MKPERVYLTEDELEAWSPLPPSPRARFFTRDGRSTIECKTSVAEEKGLVPVTGDAARDRRTAERLRVEAGVDELA